MTTSHSLAVEGTTEAVVAPIPRVLLCAGCECSEPCALALVTSRIEYGCDVARSLLGDVLDFSGTSGSIRELKSHIGRAMQGVSMHSAHEVLDKLCILPQPSNYTLATTAHGYAIIFVVGDNYITHPVVVVSD